jgi:clan AA aspartic protease
MGLGKGRVTLKNPLSPNLPPIEVDALADSGALYLCIPEHIRIQLGLEEMMVKEVTLADGGKKVVSYVGPVEQRFKNRGAFTGAVVMGNEVILGAIPMEDMDLVIIPATRTVDVNPASPNIATGSAKGARREHRGEV